MTTRDLDNIKFIDIKNCLTKFFIRLKDTLIELSNYNLYTGERWDDI